MLKAFIIGTGLTCIAGSLAAAELVGRKTLRLMDGAGNDTVVGTVSFTSDGAGTTYVIEWDLSEFGDYFLSMRPFKCLEGPEKLWCRVPYPYEIKRRIAGDELTDLEYDTLFIWKKSSDYGIDMWNGIYYKFELEDGALVGSLHEMDMDILSAPPDAGVLRPVGEYDIEPGDPDSHWLPILRID